MLKQANCLLFEKNNCVFIEKKGWLKIFWFQRRKNGLNIIGVYIGGMQQGFGKTAKFGNWFFRCFYACKAEGQLPRNTNRCKDGGLKVNYDGIKLEEL
jgi:hypothetical protein